MEKVSVSWFLGVHITADLTGGVNTAEVVNKAQQRLHFLSVITKTKTPTTSTSNCWYPDIAAQ